MKHLALKPLLGVALLLSFGAVSANPWYGDRPVPPGFGMPPVPQQAPQVSGQQELPPPVAAVKAGVDKLLDRLAKGPVEGIEGFIEQEIAPLFDFEYMARFAAGPMHRHMSNAQRMRLAGQIKRMFLGTMAEKLAGYSGQQVRYIGVRRGRSENSVEVGVAIVNPGAYPARVNFNLYRDGDDWKVYDVVANGQSAVVFYRNHFMRLMQSTRRGYPGWR